MLIDSTEVLMAYTTVSQDLDFNLIKPSVKMAEKRFIIPYLGIAFYEEIQKAVDDRDSEYDTLLDYINCVTANIAVYYYMQTGSATIDSTGVSKPRNSNRWYLGDAEQAKVETAFLNNGIDALDDLLNYLNEKIGDYPTYEDSEAYQLERNSLVPSAREIQEVFTLLHPSVTFRAMRESIRDVESKLLPSIMQDYYSNLLSMPESDLNPSDKKMRATARKAIIYLATARALITRTVDATAQGLDVIISQNKSITVQENARIEAAAKVYEGSGERELANLTTLLKTYKPTGYTVVIPVVIPDDGRPRGIHFF